MPETEEPVVMVALFPEQIVLCKVLKVSLLIAGNIVTLAVAVEIFPELSVAVSVTVFTPMLEQLKVEVFILKEGIPQLDVEPLFIPLANVYTAQQHESLDQLLLLEVALEIEHLCVSSDSVAANLHNGECKQAHHGEYAEV